MTVRTHTPILLLGYTLAEIALNFSAVQSLGRLWFKLRSFSPLPWFLLMILAPFQNHYSPVTNLLLIFCILLSESLRIWGVGFAGSVTRTRQDEVASLVHSGPFRLVRNPLYLANTVLYTTAGILFGFPVWLTSLMLLYFCLQYHSIVQYEEALLKQIIGEPYIQYCKHVPRWIPKFPPAMKAGNHIFDLKAALRSERTTLILIFVVGLVYFLKN